MSENEKLKIAYLKIDDVKPYERNNKKHPKEQVDRLEKQIIEMGFDVPIVVDENKIIIKGHARLKVLKRLKMKEVPCIIRTDLTESQKRAARIADNKLGEMAELDLDNLKLEMAELELEGIDVELTGFSSWDLEPQFQPNLPDEDEKSKSPDDKLALIVMLENENDLQTLFNELRDRGYKVKV